MIGGRWDKWFYCNSRKLVYLPSRPEAYFIQLFYKYLLRNKNSNNNNFKKPKTTSKNPKNLKREILQLCSQQNFTSL